MNSMWTEIKNAICLILWIILLMIGIAAVKGLTVIHPVSFVCSCLVCCCHYFDKLIKKE